MFPAFVSFFRVSQIELQESSRVLKWLDSFVLSDCEVNVVGVTMDPYEDDPLLEIYRELGVIPPRLYSRHEDSHGKSHINII